MLTCENNLTAPVMVETHTGASVKTVHCEIGERDDIRHFVRIRNGLNYPAQIEVGAEIASHPRYIRFKRQADREDADVNEKGWKGKCYLPEGYEYTFEVQVLSDRPNGGEQTIEVSLLISRPGDDYGTTPASLTILVAA